MVLVIEDGVGICHEIRKRHLVEWGREIIDEIKMEKKKRQKDGIDFIFITF
jgi:hypothetical protein